MSETVTVSISGTPPQITYSPSTITATSAMDIIYTVSTSGWYIAGVGKADQNAHDNLSYNSTALPMNHTSGSDPVNCLLTISPTTSITVSNSMVSSENPYTCSFSLMFTDGNNYLVHDPQVTNDPG